MRTVCVVDIAGKCLWGSGVGISVGPFNGGPRQALTLGKHQAEKYRRRGGSNDRRHL